MTRGRLRREAKAARKGGALVAHGGLSPRLSDLYQRLHAHTEFMRKRLLEGKSAATVDANKVRKIMEDFREAGLVAPTTGPLIPDLGPREAPIPSAVPTYEFLGGLDGGSGVGSGVGFGGNFGQTQVSWGDGAAQRSSLIRRGVDPKTMRSVLPYQRSSAYQGSGLPYRSPPKRLDKRALGANDWLPPWMLYGDQPNQFVKRPRVNVIAARRPGVALQIPGGANAGPNLPGHLRIVGNRLIGQFPVGRHYPVPPPLAPPAVKAAAKAAAVVLAPPAAVLPVFNVPPAPPAPAPAPAKPKAVHKKAAAKPPAPATPPPSPPAAAVGTPVPVPSPIRKKAAAAVSDATWAARIPNYARLTPRAQANAKRAWSINHP
jgi:hypothetical protein